MNTDLTAASPLNDEPERGTRKKHRRDPDANAPRPKPILSRQDCLIQIQSLNGLVAVKALSPSQANTIRANLQAIIREHDRDLNGGKETFSDDSLRQISQRDPQLLSLISDLLTPEQLDKLMHDAGDSDEPQA